MGPKATPEQVDKVVQRIKTLGLSAHPIPGKQRTAIGVTGNQLALDRDEFLLFDGVSEVVSVSKPYKLVSREVKNEDTVISFGDCHIGDGSLTVMAGPCAVESEKQILESAHIVKKAGAKFLRGGAYKPRTSPYSFQGLKEEGLKLLAKAREETGLYIITEVKDVETLSLKFEKFSGFNDCMPSDNALEGSGCTSMMSPSAPAATAALAIAGTPDQMPIPCEGSTITGKWVSR